MAAAKPRTHRKSASSKSKRASTSKKTSAAKRNTKKSAKRTTETPSMRREIYGVLVAAFTLLLTLSLVSHRPASEEHNWIGQVGQVVAEGVFFLFGIGAFVVALVSGLLAFWLLFGRKYVVRPARLIGAVLATLSIVTMFSVLLPTVEAWAVPVGGWLGTSIAGSIEGVLGRTGAVLVLASTGLIGVILVTRVSVAQVTESAVQRMQNTGDRLNVGGSVRGVTRSLWQGVTGVFSRKPSKNAPPLALEDTSDDDDFFAIDPNEDTAHTPDVQDQDAAPAVVTDTSSSAASASEAAPAEEIPVRSPDAARAAVQPSNDNAQSAPAPAPVVRERAAAPRPAAPAVAPAAAPQEPAPQESGDPSSVAARARRAIAAFRDNGPVEGAAPKVAPAPAAASSTPAAHSPAPATPHAVADPTPQASPKPPAAPAPSPHAAAAPATPFSMPQPPRVDKTPRVPVAERMDHAIHNPMDDTTRQNAALRPDDVREAQAPIVPPPAPAPESKSSVVVEPARSNEPPAPPMEPIEPQRLSTDIGPEDIPEDDAVENDGPPVISRPSQASFVDHDAALDDDLQEQDTRPIQVLPKDNVSPAPPVDTSIAQDSAYVEQDSGPQIIESPAKQSRFTSETMERALRVMEAQREKDAWTLPSLDMLSYEESTAEIDEEGLRAMATLLVEALADYKVKGRVTGICPGPVVTRFEFEPEPGTKLRKISGLATDIAMRLRAENVRIIAPIPGKGCVGVEIPNDIRETVYLKEILADRSFTEAKSKTALALGKDIEGFPVVADLSKMPHLLVAGTTGSGKSVSINSMIMSVLYNASPDDVRMILIDPKQLEFALYEDIPHLLLPVVTDPSQAATALQWAVDEMERRYRLMKSLRVRNLEGYNEKLKLLQKEVDVQQDGGKTASKFALEALSQEDPDGRPTHRHMPYLIVVVDEFADLMMAAGKDVEIAVARIAQKARAAGIHCVLATQRPSVDVLTGTIKSNFPTRISFRLISGTDSRTVIDTNGAENLLGMGDMLYRPPGSSDLVRVHGAFVDEDEIERVVNFVKDQREAEFDQSILSAQVEAMDSDSDVDEKYDDAVEVVLEAGYASISMVQRRLSVGYNRAANIVEEMERRGVVGPSGGGASRREVLI